MKITAESVAAMAEKVFIASPQSESGRYVAFETHLDRVIMPPMTIKQRLCGIYIANLQNAMARMFLETDFEYYWLLNDDVAFPADTLLRLLSHKKDIVVPLCLEKTMPHYPLIYGKDRDGKRKRITLKSGERGLKFLPQGAAGGGGMLIHRRVFETVKDPWWTVSTHQSENGIWEQSSEDFDFCDKVTDAGLEIYCDLEASVIHMANYGLRAMYDEKAREWRTVLLRETEQIVIPCATEPKPIVEVHQNIHLPKPNGKLCLCKEGNHAT